LFAALFVTGFQCRHAEPHGRARGTKLTQLPVAQRLVEKKRNESNRHLRICLGKMLKQK
jgi:hypothetical protein